MIIPEENDYYKNFQGHDRFDVPEPVYRVTAGPGGEAYLIIGSEKTALFDCGMECFSQGLISNIHELLDPLGKRPDYCILSHTHYDHIGALPDLIREWPGIKVCGAPKCAQVFRSETARKTIEELSGNARRIYGSDVSIPFRFEEMRLDHAFEEGEEISLGGITVRYYEAKGHTDCSCVYMIYPQKILFANESVSQISGPDEVNTSCLKSFSDCIDSAEKMMSLEPETIIAMHYGSIPESYNRQYFLDFINEAEWELGLIKRCIKNGLTDEEVCEVHEKIYWNDELALNHPYNANHLNTMIIIRRVRKGMEEGNGKL